MGCHDAEYEISTIWQTDGTSYSCSNSGTCTQYLTVDVEYDTVPTTLYIYIHQQTSTLGANGCTSLQVSLVDWNGTTLINSNTPTASPQYSVNTTLTINIPACGFNSTQYNNIPNPTANDTLAYFNSNMFYLTLTSIGGQVDAKGKALQCDVSASL
jgi:hypothetical protein